MKTVRINKCSGNCTPVVISALKELAGGGTLVFEQGEYHFFEEGSFIGEFSPTNNETGIKKVIFPIIGYDNITIEGNNSTFVFHEMSFPFIIKNSKCISIKNITLTTYLAPHVILKICEKHDDSFVCRIYCDDSLFYTENGNLIFKRENSEISTKNLKLSLHSVEGRMLIRYIFAGETSASKENLAVPYICCDAESFGNLITFRYRNDEKAEKCLYEKGEIITINLEEARSRDVFFLENSEDIKISGINIHRGGGMGVIGQLCRNIEIDNLIVKPSNDEKVSLTADILHFVNCSGEISIHDCDFASSLDDACNVHGNYSSIIHAEPTFIDVAYCHEAHKFFELYKPGDTLTVINNKTLDIIGEFKVKSSSFTDDSGLRQRIYSESEIDFSAEKGFFVESALRMPDIHVYNNKNYNIPNWRLSGAGKILVENNTYDECNTPIYAFDLAEYWYESGRIKNLTVKNNIFRNTKFPQGSIVTGVSGFAADKMPIIHENITIEDNTFVGIKNSPFDIHAFKNITVKNNTFDGKKQEQ